MKTIAKKASVLDAESAQKVLDADLANILKKVKAGKPLSTRERRTVSAGLEEKEFAETVGELQGLLGLERNKYQKLKKLEGSPTDLNLEAWREFVSVAEMTTNNGRMITPKEVGQLKARLLSERTKREEIERKLKELRLEREEGGWIPYEEAEAAITRVLEPVNRLLDGIPKRYSMRVNPADSDHAEEMMREMVVELKEQIFTSRGKKISKRKGVK
jgi:hypothetical protein